MRELVVEHLLRQLGLLVHALVLPNGSVGELVVVAQGLTLLGLVLRAEVTTARLRTVQSVASHQLTQLQVIGQTQGLLQLYVERHRIANHLNILPELLAKCLDLRDSGLERLLRTSHTYILPHDVAQLLVNIVYRLLTIDRHQLLDLLLHGLLSLVECRGIHVYLRSLNLLREVVADRVGKYEVTISQTLHQCRSTQTVSTVVREVGLTDSVQTRDRGHQVVVNPDTTHGVVYGGEDLHRLLVGAYVGDLLIHIEEVAITLLDDILTQTLDSGLEIEEYRETRLVHTETGIATLLGGTRSNVARYEVTECGVTTLQVVVAILLLDVRRLERTGTQGLYVLELLRNPDTTVVTQRLRHQRQLRLLRTVYGDTGGSSMGISASYFPANFTKENAFAMINQYDPDKGSTSTSSSKTLPERIMSYFGRVNYTLMDRYLFTFTFRADGSSKFSPDHRWGYFPAAAFAWRMSEESWLKDTDWLDNLKIRLSYGQVGNDGISSNLWSQNWAAETDYRYMYYSGQNAIPTYKYSASQMVNPDLKWETTITRNLGVDFGFWNNRLSGTVDVYWNTTKDLLMQTAIPGITGFTATYDNVGQTSNKGVEISLSGVIVDKKDFRLTAGVNVNFNRGNVDELADSVTGLYGSNWCSSATTPAQDYTLMVDQPVGLVRGWVFDGIYTVDDFTYDNGVYTLKEGVADSKSMYQQLNGIPAGARPDGQTAYPGMGKYKDLDGDGDVDNEDITVIGDMTPDCTGGFNLNAQWKGFDLGAYFNWSIGNEVYNAHKLASMHGGKEAGLFENKLAFLKDSFMPFTVKNGNIEMLYTPSELAAANEGATMPFGYQENGIISTIGIEDGSFLRLNTLTLGYTLPQQLTKKAGISNCRVYASIYNVFTLTGYSGLDPEVNTNTAQGGAAYPTVGLDWGAYPRARSFVVGLNLSF